MINLEQMALILKALPDPAFILSRSGKYLALFGGRDARYYHDGSGLVGCYIADLIKPDKARWFLDQIALALDSRQLLIAEYELSNRDVKDLPDDGPQQPIWFEGRVQALDFQVSGEDVVLWVASNISARHELELQLKALSDTDQLTGLFNRRKLEYELGSHYELTSRYGVQNSILMFDLDNLKIINDTLGHQAGDELIQVVAAVCRSELRQNDIACRFGGDEFVIVLPNTGARTGVTVCSAFAPAVAYGAEPLCCGRFGGLGQYGGSQHCAGRWIIFRTHRSALIGRCIRPKKKAGQRSGDRSLLIGRKRWPGYTGPAWFYPINSTASVSSARSVRH